MPKPLAIASPVFAGVLWVVVALVDLGWLEILLVRVPNIKELPSLARLIFVPSTVITPPAVKVVPDPRS